MRGGHGIQYRNALREVAEFLNAHQLSRTRIRFQNVVPRPITGDGLDRPPRPKA